MFSASSSEQLNSQISHSTSLRSPDLSLQFSMARRSGMACMKCICLVVLAVASALCVSSPALYWRYNKSFSSSSSPLSWIVPFSGLTWTSGPSCPSCSCQCPPPVELQTLTPGLANLSITDCGETDPELRKELQKQLVDLLTEELKLEELVSEEHGRHANATLSDARRSGAQFQRETEKCNAATEACEEARERAEAALMRERKVTETWERRARQMGWQE